MLEVNELWLKKSLFRLVNLPKQLGSEPVREL
jgi:hypothetical protein